MKCGGCEKKYNGKTARTIGVMMFKEHTDAKHPNSAVTECTSITGLKYILTDVNVLLKEDSDFKRQVKEAIAIHKNQAALMRDRDHKIPMVLLQLLSCDHSGHVMK